jgi:hypothetical protein
MGSMAQAKHDDYPKAEPGLLLADIPQGIAKLRCRRLGRPVSRATG